MNIEVAIDEFAHAHLAHKLGADRIELCDNLNEGGTTPSFGLIKACTDKLDIPAYVMIRCRPGDFNYSNDEIEIMLNDIEAVAKLGAHGVVFGVLNNQKEFELEKNSILINKAQSLGLKTTFHRAFDVCVRPDEVFGELMRLGFDNVLTSGHAPSAAEGAEYITSLVRRSAGQIHIIAGKGVAPENAEAIMKTNVDTIHFTCRKPRFNQVDDAVAIGSQYDFNEKKFLDIKLKRDIYSSSSH